jgi:NAD-dependent oxidoreductase involved in siderophore biosynthesis
MENDALRQHPLAPRDIDQLTDDLARDGILLLVYLFFHIRNARPVAQSARDR